MVTVVPHFSTAVFVSEFPYKVFIAWWTFVSHVASLQCSNVSLCWESSACTLKLKVRLNAISGTQRPKLEFQWSRGRHVHVSLPLCTMHRLSGVLHSRFFSGAHFSEHRSASSTALSGHVHSASSSCRTHRRPLSAHLIISSWLQFLFERQDPFTNCAPRGHTQLKLISPSLCSSRPPLSVQSFVNAECA